MENGLSSSRDVVLVTGFGPFSIHECNPSWEAVQRLETVGLRSDVDLVTCHIPVQYDYVLSQIQTLWKKHKPKLVVHCGVSGVAKELTLEQLAHNSGYKSEDVKGSLPPNNCCVCNGPEVIRSGIEMKKVCDVVNSSPCSVKAIVSEDPGRYLCDFIYFTSLNIDHQRTAFIHVPPLDKPYSVEKLTEAIRVAILAMLDQLADKKQCVRVNGVS